MTAVRPSSSLPSVSVPYSAERGGMIIIIFIMVALFAALSYAVSDSFRLNASSTNVVSEEKMRLAYTDIQNVVETHKIAIYQAVKGGIAIETLSPDYTDSSGKIWYLQTNTDCLTPACHLYYPTGLGLQWFKWTYEYPELTDVPNTEGWDPNAPVWISVAGVGTEVRDLVYLVRITKDFCNFINKQLGLDPDIDATSQVTIHTWENAMYDNHDEGTSVDADSLTGTNQAPHLKGQRQGCFKVDGPSPSGNILTYRYFGLLFPR